MIPLVQEVTTRLKYSAVTYGVLLIVVALSFRSIYQTGNYYTQRLSYMASLVDKQSSGQSKFTIPKSSMDENRILARWAFAYETLLYSSLSGPENGKSFYVIEDPGNFEFDLNDASLFLALPFERDRKIDELNKKYFYLPLQKYQMLP
jgi:hypothetical protein